jgi:alanine dehydrogenase
MPGASRVTRLRPGGTIALMLVFSRRDVEALLDLSALIDALAPAMADLSAGRSSVPNRVAAAVAEHDGLLAAMPAYAPANGALTTKLVSLFPRNARTDLPTHQAVIVAFDPSSGEPLALLDGTAITALRTAAGSALSARLLAREDATTLAILGTGVQARSHAQAVPLVREFAEIRVAGRRPEAAQQLADELREAGLAAAAAESFEAAVRDADVVCAATHALEPVVHGEWLAPGTHVTSVGYDPSGREVDDAVVTRSSVFVESRAAALAPVPAGSPDLTEPIAAGLLRERDVREIGELVAGSAPGRAAPDEITLYKSVGVGVQDAVATALVLAAADERGVGQSVDF